VKVVLDTNVLISGVFWGGPAGDILNLWARDKLSVVTSPAILSEYERVLEEMDRRKPSGLSGLWKLFVAQHSSVIHPTGSLKVCRDPDDDKFLDCAVAAGCRYVVSGDKDLLVLKAVERVEIISPAAFLRALR
jgi:uncharacterized protein